MSPNISPHGITILVVGTAAAGRWLQSQLQGDGHQVYAAADEQAAFAQAKVATADLILVLLSPSVAADLKAERLQALCGQLKQGASTCHIPVVVVSPPGIQGNVMSQQAALMAGAADYIKWPTVAAPDQVAAQPSEDVVAALFARLDPHLAIVRARHGATSPTATRRHHRPISSRTPLQQSTTFSPVLRRIIHRIRKAQGEAQILQVTVEELCDGLGLAGGVAAIRSPGMPVIHASAICDRYHHSAAADAEQWAVEVTAPLRQLWVNPRLGAEGSLQFCYSHPQWRQQVGLVCAIADDYGVLGDLRLSRPAPRGLTPEEVCLAQHVADQCAIAIRQARLYKTAQEQVELLEDLHRQKDDFLSTVSHELRSPVTNMKLALQMLTMSLEGLEAATPGEAGRTAVATAPIAVTKLKQYLQILSGECDREINLINNLLDLQRLDAGAQAANVVPVPLESWLADLVRSFEERMGDRHQVLRFEPLAALPAFKTDIAAVQRIITELLDNLQVHPSWRHHHGDSPDDRPRPAAPDH